MAIDQVIKRDGRRVPFDRKRIENAIYAAARAVGNGESRQWAETLSWAVTGILEERFGQEGHIPHVEEIQDIVEEVLIKSGHPQIAKAYILYRQKRAEARAAEQMLLDTTQLVDDYLDQTDWRVSENSNMNYSLQGLNFYLASSIAARYWLHKIYPPEVQRAHIEGDFHIHDLGALSSYCTGWDLQDLLIRGFGGVPAKIESRPPRHLRTALGQLVNFFYTVQGEVAGAVAVSNFDTLLAPFIRYDRLDEAGVKQAVQEFIFNINVPTRVGFQSLVWDELVVLRRNGRIEVTEIGRLVDEQFERNRHRILNQGNHSYAVANADAIQVLAFGPDGRTIWAPIKAFVRHRVPQGAAFLRVRTSRGTARVSQAHSLFAFETLDGQFTPRPITAREVEVVHGNARITPTNHFIAVRRAPNGGTRESLDLVELIDTVPQVADRVRVRIPDQPQAVRHLQERVRRHFGGLTPFYLEYGIKDKGCWRRWSNPEGGALPYRIWRAFGDNEEEAEFSLRNSDLWYPRTLDGERLREFVHLLAWYITEGHNDITNGLYVSQARGGDQEEMARVLGALGALGRTEKMRGWSAQGNPTCEVIRMAGKGLLAVLIGYLGGTYSTNKVIPWFVYDLAPALQEAFIATLFRGDASEFPKYFDYTTTSRKLSLGLSLLLAMNGYKFSVYETSYDREEWNDQYTLRVYKDKDAAERYAVGDLLARICLRQEAFAYQGEYEYDLSVDMEMENFAGGSGLLCFHNTPFTNITMDLTPPPTLRDQPVIIGGKPQEAAYGEFQREMDLLNCTFAEVMLEGDARSRVFSFPIPTYNITRDFSWENPALEPVWRMTARYGIPYFANFINSDMNPEDARSMCLFPTEMLLVKENGVIRKTTIGELFAAYSGSCIDGAWFTVNRKVEVLSLNPDTGGVEWTRVVRFLQVRDRELVTIRTRDGKTMRVSGNHLVAVFTEEGIRTKKAKDVTKEDLLLVLKDGSSALGEGTLIDLDLAWFMGFFVADGNYLYDTRYAEKRLRGVQLSFNARNKHLVEKVRALVKRFVDYDMKFILDPRYPNSLRGYVFSRSFSVFLSEKYDLRKYGGLPVWIWSAAPSVIKAFLQGFFDGDGYQDGKEVHINDEGLARELNLLMQLVGISTTYRVRERSQTIRIQHTLGRAASGRRVVKDTLHNMVPQFLMDKKYVRDEHGRNLYQSYGCRMVGLSSIDRWGLSNEKMERLRKSAFAVVPVDDLQRETLACEQVFYDIELEKNHYFVHSDGNISHNCCRLRLDNRELRKRIGGLFAAAPLTGSVGVVTINMPRLAYLAEDEEDFFRRLERLMEIARTSLEIKRKMLEHLTERGLYPYSRHYLEAVKMQTGAYWSNHFSTIGLIGMNEACLNLLGVGIADPAGKDLAVRTLNFMRQVLSRFQEETGNLYNLEATPAEGASYRLARADRKRHPNIRTAGTPETPYYTNSTHLPVSYSDDLFEVLEHQDELQTLYTGGTVLHIFLGERLHDGSQARRLVRLITENYRLPYFTITPTFSICPVHGYIPGEHFFCPYEHTAEELARYGVTVKGFDTLRHST